MARVSCIISTFNRAEHFLPRAIRSVLAQTEQDWELRVVDDCSTDATAKVVQAFMKEDSRIGYDCTLQNTGYQCAPKNLGLRGTSAPFITYLDDDNAWHENHLERLLAGIGDADLAYCNRTYSNDPVHPHPSPPCLGLSGPTGYPWDPLRIRFENWIDTSDILHTRASLDRLGGWNEAVRRVADWDLVRRYAEAKMKVVHVPEVLTTYYWHAQGNIGRLPLQPVAIWTLTKNRLWHTLQMMKALQETTRIAYDHYVLDQGSTDGTPEFLLSEYRAGRIAYLRLEPENIGISRGSNHLLDVILPGDQYAWVVKLDQDVVLQTPLWFERMVAKWQEKLVLSPHILGLIQHPGGAPRRSFDYRKRLGFADHLGGACNVAPLAAWKDFGRWITPAPAHGQQDSEFSGRVKDKGWRLAYCEDVLARHLGNTPEDIRAQERQAIL